MYRPEGKWFVPIFILAVLSLLLSNCRRHLDVNKHQAEAVWTYHERVIERAIESETTDPSFAAACRFFATLTGVEIRGEGSYFGWHATQQTAEDLAEIRKYFRSNRNRLHWNTRMGTVEVRTAP